MTSNTSIPSVLIDEISLEGLEGITFESLWLRLEQRVNYYEEYRKHSDCTTVQLPKPWLTLESLKSERFRDACFRIVLIEAKKKNVQLYKLPTPRPPIILFDRNQHYIEESGTVLYDETKIPDNIYYPVIGVDEGPVRGSCRDYKKRTNITDQILLFDVSSAKSRKSSSKTRFNYKEFCTKFNQKQIVIVGSEECRARALFDEIRWPEYRELTIECYIMLELIGRQRNFGVLNVGKEAIIFDDPTLKTSLYAFRTKILSEKLIIQLLIFYYNPIKKQCSNSLVLFLPRFRPVNINPIDYKAIEVAKIFQQKKCTKLSMSTLRSYGEGVLFKDFSLKRIRFFLQRFPKMFTIFYDTVTSQLSVRYLKSLENCPTVEDLYDLRAHLGNNAGKQSSPDNNEEDIIDVEDEDGDVDEDIKDVEDDIKDVEDDIKDVEDDIKDVEDEDGDVEDDIKDVEDDIKDVEDDIKDVEDDIKDVEDEDGDVEDDIKDVEDDIKDVEDDIKDVEDDIKGVEDDIKDVEDEEEEYSNDIDVNELKPEAIIDIGVDDVEEDSSEHDENDVEDRTILEDSDDDIYNFELPELKDLIEDVDNEEDDELWDEFNNVDEDNNDEDLPEKTLDEGSFGKDFGEDVDNVNDVNDEDEDGSTQMMLNNLHINSYDGNHTDSDCSIDIEQFLHEITLFDETLIDRIYWLIDSKGSEGLTLSEIQRFVDIPRIYCRNALKVLTKQQRVGIKIIAKFRSKAFHHVASRYLNDDHQHKKQKSSKSKSDEDPSSSQWKLLKRSSKFSDVQSSRIELMLKFLQQQRYLDNPVLLQNYIYDAERSQPHRCDVRSVYRILIYLYDANFIHLYKYRLSYGLYYRNLCLILYNHNFTPKTNSDANSASNEEERSIVEHLLLKNKFQFFASLMVDLTGNDIEISLMSDWEDCQAKKPGSKKLNLAKFVRNFFETTGSATLNKGDVEDPVMIQEDEEDSTTTLTTTPRSSSKDVDHGKKILLTLDAQQSLSAELHLVYQPSLAKKFGCNLHRIESIFELYRFLFFFLVDPKSNTEYTSTEWQNVIPKLANFFPDRKCYPIDFLPYLPMAIIVKIFRIRFLIPGFEQLLKDPERQCQMLYQVDPNIRRHFLYGRKAIGELIEHLQHLSWLGLISWSNWKESERYPERHCSFQLNTLVKLNEKSYDFEKNVDDFEAFVQDVFWHVLDLECKQKTIQMELKKKDVEVEVEEDEDEEDQGLTKECPFDSRLKIHHIPLFIAKRELYQDDNISSDEEEEEEEEYWDDNNDDNDDIDYNNGKENRKSKRSLNNKPRKSDDTILKSSNRTKRLKTNNDDVNEEKSKKKKKPKLISNTKKDKSLLNLLSKTKKKKKKKKNESPKKLIEKKKKKSYDEEDEERNIINRRYNRSVWTREEDHFLMKCRLASMLMDPKSRTLLCVPRAVVRDLLHQCVGPKSFSKDALSVARRMRRFKTKLKFRRLLRFCLHELDYIEIENRDENGELPEAPQFTNRAERNESENWIRQFKRVLQQILNHDFICTEFFLDKSLLRQRRLMAAATNMTTTNDNQPGRIPNLPIGELLKRYDIVNPYQQSVESYFDTEPKNYYDIHSYVIANILLSALLSVKFTDYYQQRRPTNSSSSFIDIMPTTSKRQYRRTVYKSLKHFPETVVRWILKRLNQFEIISHNKSLNPKSAERKLDCYAYRITANFFNKLISSNVRLDRSGSTRAPWIPPSIGLNNDDDSGTTSVGTIIKDTNSAFSALQFIECFTADILGIGPGTTIAADSEGAGSSDLVEPSLSSLIPSINFDVEIPDKFITKTSLQSSKPSEHDGKKKASLSRILLMRGKSVGEVEEEEIPGDEDRASHYRTPFHEEMKVNHCRVQIRRTGPEPAAECLQDTNILDLLQFHLQTFDTLKEFSKHRTNISQQPLKKQNSLDFDFSDYETLALGGSLPTSSASSSIATLKIIKPLGTLTSEDPITSENYLDVIEFIRSKKELGVKMGKLLEFLGINPEVVVSTPNVDRTTLFEDHVDEDEDEDGEGIPAMLQDDEEVELSSDDLVPGTEDKIVHFLRYLELKQLIFCVGILERTWVHRDSMQFWLVPSYLNLEPPQTTTTTSGSAEPELTQPSTSGSLPVTTPTPPSVPIKPISFLPKLWKLPDGRLNREILFAYFNQIIGFLCFEKPKIAVDDLVEQFKPMVPPVQLLELIEMLTELGCVRRLLVKVPIVDPYRPLCFDHYFMEPDELALEIRRLTRGQFKQEIYYESTNDTYTRLAFFYRALED